MSSLNFFQPDYSQIYNYFTFIALFVEMVPRQNFGGTLLYLNVHTSIKVEVLVSQLQHSTIIANCFKYDLKSSIIVCNIRKSGEISHFLKKLKKKKNFKIRKKIPSCCYFLFKFCETKGSKPLIFEKMPSFIENFGMYIYHVC